MNDKLHFFTGKYCKSNNHSICDGSWNGLGISVHCECDCHRQRKSALVLEEVVSLGSNTTRSSFGEENRNDNQS